MAGLLRSSAGPDAWNRRPEGQAMKIAEVREYGQRSIVVLKDETLFRPLCGFVVIFFAAMLVGPRISPGAAALMLLASLAVLPLGMAIRGKKRLTIDKADGSFLYEHSGLLLMEPLWPGLGHSSRTVPIETIQRVVLERQVYDEGGCGGTSCSTWKARTSALTWVTANTKCVRLPERLPARSALMLLSAKETDPDDP